MDLQVQKKDGRLEPFDRDKIKSGLLKSGASKEEAEKIAADVEVWAQNAAQNGIVSTFSLRNKVLEILKEINPTAANAFEFYRKPKQ